MRKSIILGSLAAVGLAGQTLAADESFSYSYLEANYINANVDGLDSNADGAGVNGSISFTPMLHGYLEYSNLDFDGTTVQSWEVGTGFNRALSPTVDLIGRAAYARIDASGLDAIEGYALQLGLRGRPADKFELEGLVHYSDFAGSRDNTSLRVNGRYFFAPQFAGVLGVDWDDDRTIWNVGVRWNFKNR